MHVKGLSEIKRISCNYLSELFYIATDRRISATSKVLKTKTCMLRLQPLPLLINCHAQFKSFTNMIPDSTADVNSHFTVTIIKVPVYSTDVESGIIFVKLLKCA